MHDLSLLLVPVAADLVARQFEAPAETDATILRKAERAARRGAVARLVRSEISRLTGAVATLSARSTRRPAH